MLEKKSGVAAGARLGSASVNQPIIRKHELAKSCVSGVRATSTTGIKSTRDSDTLSQTFSVPINNAKKKVPNVEKQKDGTFTFILRPKNQKEKTVLNCPSDREINY